MANGPSLAGGQPEGASGLALAWPQRVGARLASAAWRSPFSSPGAASFPRSKLTPEHQASWREWAGVNNHTRGGGWWRWKPYYLLRELRAVRQGDVMVHTDYDLQLTSQPAALWCLGQNAAQGVATFHFPCLTDRAWTKAEVASALGSSAPMLDTG